MSDTTLLMIFGLATACLIMFLLSKLEKILDDMFEVLYPILLIGGIGYAIYAFFGWPGLAIAMLVIMVLILMVLVENAGGGR
jgi:hypothetical protein